MTEACHGSVASSVTIRAVNPEAQEHLLGQGISPLMARLYAAREIHDIAQLATDLSALLAPQLMLGITQMAAHLADAIAAQRKLLIIADYDADGATACAVGLRALRQFGATVDYLVPNRFEYGYGLTPEIVALAITQHQPDILITVDNGIASIDGVAAANSAGIKVLITDHHLPGDHLPDAWCIVNPNQPGCTFPSKHLAGVGVIFYVMLALRAELRERGTYRTQTEPNLSQWLDLVALGTVADVVKLDDNNRRLVEQGLQRIRNGRSQAGIQALLAAAGREHERVGTYDLGFVVGPRLNAAGRLTDMSLGIECLTTNDATRAAEIAAQLDQLNHQRRDIEADMQASALAELAEIPSGYTLSVYHPQWHQGVIGILASRLREQFHRPTFAFATGAAGELKGSGRSIPGLHLRDALDLISKRQPQLILRFGGHAAAAGLTIAESAFATFQHAFESVAQELLSAADLTRQWVTDGPLAVTEATLAQADIIATHVWGQGFPEPRFFDQFKVIHQRIVGTRHLKLRLAREAVLFEAILFGQAEFLPEQIEASYRLSTNHYKGASTLQLIIEHWQPVSENNL